MGETSHQPPELAIAVPRRTSATGAERCYVRLAVMGDRATWRANGPRLADWPQLLAGAIGAVHDLSWCDVRSARASTYDVRRVQLRVAVAHRPHVVALAAGLVDVRSREWDLAEARSHLLHCARVLSQRGAVLLTTGPAAHRGPVGGRRSAVRLSRMRQLDDVYDELHERFGTIHLDPVAPADRSARPSAAELAGRFARELARRGLELPAA